MRTRKHPIEMFSTFLQVDEARDTLGPAWLTDSRLKQNMTRVSQTDADAPEEFWTLYWLREALKYPQNQLARGHLSAYLEEVCYWVTRKIFQEVANIRESRVDCFFIARSAAANPEKLFKNYDQIRSSLKTYAQLRLKTAILEQIRVGSSLQRYSDPALLRALTKKTLKEALQKANIKEPEFSRCLLAWQCFKEVYVPAVEAGRRQLKPPDEAQLDAIAALYNQASKNRLDAVNSQSIQKLLEQSIVTVRASLRISTVSLDNCLFEPALASDDPIDALDKPAQEWQQVNSILSAAIARVPEPNYMMLKLFYGLAFRQSEIGQFFGQKQYNVSRQISRTEETLLQSLAEWIRDQLEIDLTSEKLQNICQKLEEWLEYYCQLTFLELLNHLVPVELAADIELLRLYYGKGLKPQEIVRELKITESVFDQRIALVKQKLIACLYSHLQSQLGSQISSVNSTEKRLSSFVENFLAKAPYAIWK